MEQNDIVKVFKKLKCDVNKSYVGDFIEVYDKNDPTTEIATISVRFKIVLFYDESIMFNRLTKEIIENKVKNFAIREKMYVIQKRLLEADKDFV